MEIKHMIETHREEWKHWDSRDKSRVVSNINEFISHFLNKQLVMGTMYWSSSISNDRNTPVPFPAPPGAS
jgi:hypothetical protein